ncbi:MAG: hypothetical protein ACRCUE_13925 [Bosea sp. (in: a-proteobacteria)]
MSARFSKLLGASALSLYAIVGTAQAFEVTNAVWDRYTLDTGKTAGLSLRGYRMPQFAPTLTPIVGVNYENAQTASAVRGAWMEAARIGPFAIGPVITVERHLALSNRATSVNFETERSTRFGGFLAFTSEGQEVGRVALTTGRTGGFDVRATRSFKLNDNVTLDIGPTISLGSFERFGYEQAARSVSSGIGSGSYNADRAQLGAFGLATAIETRISERTVARMFADYARVDAQRGQIGANTLQNRDRVDFGFSLTTQIGR